MSEPVLFWSNTNSSPVIFSSTRLSPLGAAIAGAAAVTMGDEASKTRTMPMIVDAMRWDICIAPDCRFGSKSLQAIAVYFLIII